MNLKEKILLFMQESAYKPLNAEDLALEMEIRGKELIEFWRALEELEHDAKIFKTRYDKYGIPEKMSLVVGRLSLSSKGFGFVIPENPLTEDESDLYIAQDDLKTAMHNDFVIARVNRQNLAGRSREGEIVRIVNRANKKIIGTFDASKNFGFVIPDDKRIGQDIFVARENFNKAKVGAKVVVEIINWPDKQRSAEGKIVEVLGYKGDVGIEILSIIKKHDLAMEFPAEVEQEANKVPEQVMVDDSENRRELRDKIIAYAMREFHQRGVKAVKMDEISRGLRVSKRTVYEIFGDKEELLLAGMKIERAEYKARVEQYALTHARNVIDVIGYIYRLQMERNQQVGVVFYEEIHRMPRILEFLKEEHDKEYDDSMRFFQAGVDEGYFRKDVNFEVVYESSRICMSEMMHQQLYKRFTMQELFDNFTLIMIRGFCTDRGLELLDKAIGQL